MLRKFFKALCNLFRSCLLFYIFGYARKYERPARSIVEVALAIAAPLKRGIHIAPPSSAPSPTLTLSTAFLLLSVFARNTWHEQAGPHDLQLLLSKFDYDDSGVLCSLELQERCLLMSYSHSRMSTRINFFLNNDLMYYSFYYAFNHLSLSFMSLFYLYNFFCIYALVSFIGIKTILIS